MTDGDIPVAGNSHLQGRFPIGAALATYVVAYSCVAVWATTNELGWGDDWAQYVMHSLNIVQGRPYSDILYFFNRDYPSIGPPSYPPGLPLLLAPTLALVGLDFYALKLTSFAFVIAALPIGYLVLAPAFGRVAAFVAVVAFSLHPITWGFHRLIVSESPFIFFSLLALMAGSIELPRGASSSRSFWLGAAVGAVVFAAIACRSVGMALVPALLVFGWGKRRPLTWFAGFGLCLAGLLTLQSRILVGPPMYDDELILPTFALVSHNVFEYLRALSYYFPFPYPWSAVAALALASCALIGIVSFATRDPGRWSVSSLRDRVGAIPLAIWYLLGYLSAFVLASIEPSPRYLLPIVLIAFAAAIQGAMVLADRVRMGRAIAAATGASLAIATGIAFAGEVRNPHRVTCQDCREMFAYVREHTPADSVVTFVKPRAMGLLASRRTWAPAMDYTPAQFEVKVRSTGTSIAVVPSESFAKWFPTSPALMLVPQDPAWTEAYRNATFAVYRRAST